MKKGLRIVLDKKKRLCQGVFKVFLDLGWDIWASNVSDWIERRTRFFVGWAGVCVPFCSVFLSIPPCACGLPVLPKLSTTSVS